jgi:hypothetical protein
MGVTRLLAAGRRRAEALMVDRCVIRRPRPPVTDPETGKVTTPLEPVYGTEAEPGRCKVQAYEAQEATPESGGATLTVQRYRVDVPVSAPGGYVPQVGDVVEVVTAAADPNLAGRTYRTAGLLHKSLATAYRLGVQENA